MVASVEVAPWAKWGLSEEEYLGSFSFANIFFYNLNNPEEMIELCAPEQMTEKQRGRLLTWYREWKGRCSLATTVNLSKGR